MDMGIFSVMVGDGHPLEVGKGVFLHLPENIPREALQIHAVAKLRGEDYLPQPLVTGRLPLP